MEKLTLPVYQIYEHHVTSETGNVTEASETVIYLFCSVVWDVFHFDDYTIHLDYIWTCHTHKYVSVS